MGYTGSMRSVVTPAFRKMLDDLPERVQAAAREGFATWKQDRQAVGWKRLTGPVADLYSVQIGSHWRAIALVSKPHDAVVWLFVGSHETYNHYIKIQRSTTQQQFLSRLCLRLQQQRAAATPAVAESSHPKRAFR